MASPQGGGRDGDEGGGGGDEVELEWEEWDGESPFLHHCVAGSIAGVAEHTLLFPVDTVKTHMQSYCADCPHNAAAAANTGKSVSGGFGTSPTAAVRGAAKNVFTSGGGAPQQQHGMWRTMSNLFTHGHAGHAASVPSSHPPPLKVVGLTGSGSSATIENEIAVAARTRAGPSSQKGFVRLWRGVQAMAVGCVPAHALYFSSYEIVKSAFLETTIDVDTGRTHHHLGAMGSSAAGATATIFHDSIMTPLDTVKQRLQLGHYEGMADALRHIVRHEGKAGLYRSFPITVLTNVPYGMVMVSTNEYLKETLNPSERFDLTTCVMAGCGAGAAAAAATTPLDRIKTRLQTQRLGSVEAVRAACEAAAASGKAGKDCPRTEALRPRYDGLATAFRSIVREEGYAGLFRGMTPRLLTHTPAVAISWTTYEWAKRWLATTSTTTASSSSSESS